MVNSGCLYGVGVGPGDPELLTLKALRVIQSVQVVAVPYSKENEESYALNIVSDYLLPRQAVKKLYFPMTKDLEVRKKHRQAAALELAELLRDGVNVAFLTEGDPLLHSTFQYILEHLPPSLPVQVIPGISSVMAAAAEAQFPLVSGHQRLAVIPSTFESPEDLRMVFAQFDTVVLMKVHTVLRPVIELLREYNLLDRAVIVERASHPLQKVYRNIESVDREALHYLSLMIVHTRREGAQ